MKDWKPHEESTEKLVEQRKSLRNIGIMVGIVVLMYLFYFSGKLISGSWNFSHSLGMIVLGVLVTILILVFKQRAEIKKELDRRKN